MTGALNLDQLKMLESGGPDTVFRAVLDALPVATYITGPSGHITYCNPAASELAGRRPEIGKDKWCVGWKLYRPDGTPITHEDSPLAQTLREGRPVPGEEILLERPDGSRVLVKPRPSIIRGPNGEIAGAVNTLIDIAEIKSSLSLAQAERAIHQLAAIVDSSDDAIISKNLDGIIVSWNPAASRLFGYTAEEAIGKSVTMLIPDEHLDEEPEIIERIRRGERIEHYETIRRRKDGSLFNISITVSPVRNASGAIVGASKIARNITERKLNETQRDLMVAELSHRVKNTLATVVSIARQSFSKDANPEDARRSFEGRIQALAQTHSRLAEGNWSGVSLETALLDELLPYRGDDGKNILVSGPYIVANPRAAVVLGMAFHELATNAAKYGALSSKGGVLKVAWEMTPEQSVRVRWTETGGPAVKAPTRSGFGRLLLERALVSDLEGKVSLEFLEQGLQCSIEFPLRGVADKNIQ